MDCTKESADIVVNRFKQLKEAVENDDLSQASSPLLGDSFTDGVGSSKEIKRRVA